MNVYTGKWNQQDWYQVFLDGKPFDPRPSQKLINHSPDGFAWGYGGSGPSQLALAILLNETKDPALAQNLYQKFKSDVIAKLPQEDSWTLTGDDVSNWITHNRTDITFQINPKSSRHRLTGDLNIYVDGNKTIPISNYFYRLTGEPVNNTEAPKRHRLTGDIHEPKDSCACCDTPFMDGLAACSCKGNTFAALCSNCEKCGNHCKCPEFGLGKSKVKPQAKIGTKDTAWKQAYYAWRRAAEQGYGEGCTTPECMKKVDDKIRSLKQKYETLLAESKKSKQSAAYGVTPYSPKLRTPEAHALYGKILDYMMIADDPQYERICTFKRKIQQIKDLHDQEELKKYFESEFSGSHTQGDAWDYYEASTHKSPPEELFKQFISYLDKEEAPTRYRAEEKLLETIRKAETDPDALEAKLREVIQKKFGTVEQVEKKFSSVPSIKARLGKIADYLQREDDNG